MSGSETPEAPLDDERPDWRGPVLAAATWAGVWAGTSGVIQFAGWGAVAALVIGAWTGWRRRWLVAGAALALLIAVAIGGARATVKGVGPVADWAGQGAVVSIDARLAGGHLSGGGRGGPMWIVDADLVRIEGRGVAWESGATVRLTASGELARSWSLVPVGATVAAVVRLAPAAADEPVSAWARARGSPTVIAPPSPLDSTVTTVRAGLRAAVAGLPPEPAALVPALVVGDTDGMSDSLQAQFRTTGLTHLTAVSGGNRRR